MPTPCCPREKSNFFRVCYLCEKKRPLTHTRKEKECKKIKWVSSFLFFEKINRREETQFLTKRKHLLTKLIVCPFEGTSNIFDLLRTGVASHEGDVFSNEKKTPTNISFGYVKMSFQTKRKHLLTKLKVLSARRGCVFFSKRSTKAVLSTNILTRKKNTKC